MQSTQLGSGTEIKPKLFVVQGGFTGGLVHGPLGDHVGQGLVAHDAGVSNLAVPQDPMRAC